MFFKSEIELMFWGAESADKRATETKVGVVLCTRVFVSFGFFSSNFHLGSF